MRPRWTAWAVCVVLAAAGTGLATLHHSEAADQPSVAPPPATPVTVTTATRRDVPVYLRGLGTVQAFNSVVVKAQVNGVLLQVPVAEGQEVKQGDVLAVIDPRPYKAALDQATAQRQKDQAQLQAAQLDLKRYQDLSKRGDAPVQQVDDQLATVNSDTAAVAADDAAIETAGLNLSYCYIRAPFDGKVSLRMLDPGNLIEVAAQTTGIITLVQDHPISVVFTLPEDDLPQIESAMQATPGGKLQTLAFDSGDTKQLAQGELQTPNNAIDQSTGTISIKSNFANTDNSLWPGQFVNARLLVNTMKNVVTVPRIAIQHAPDALYVYLVKPDNTVARQDVKLSYQDETTVVVAQGLNGGEKVVTGGVSRLQQGSHVTINTPPASS
jgi:multidrug efflux system membrane fusion protein